MTGVLKQVDSTLQSRQCGRWACGWAGPTLPILATSSHVATGAPVVQCACTGRAARIKEGLRKVAISHVAHLMRACASRKHTHAACCTQRMVHCLAPTATKHRCDWIQCNNTTCTHPHDSISTTISISVCVILVVMPAPHPP